MKRMSQIKMESKRTHLTKSPPVNALKVEWSKDGHSVTSAIKKELLPILISIQVQELPDAIHYEGGSQRRKLQFFRTQVKTNL